MQFLGWRETLIHRLEFRAWTVLIVGALNKDLGSCTVLDVIRRTPARGKASGQKEMCARRGASQPRDHTRAERKAGEPVRHAGIAIAEPRDRSPCVFNFAFQM